jgi:hypothetical protein
MVLINMMATMIAGGRQSQKQVLLLLRLRCSFSSSSSSSSDSTTSASVGIIRSSLYRPEDATIKVEGDLPYGLRRYLLVQDRPAAEDNDDNDDAAMMIAESRTTAVPGGPLVLASLTAHRNVVFGAKKLSSSSSSSSTDDLPLLSTLCEPLLIRALEDCYSNGEQPQALSALHGLTAYVRQCLDGQLESPALQEMLLLEEEKDDNNDATTNKIQYEAVRAIATGLPRPGHTVVGPGTHRDAGLSWAALAREYIQQGRCDECVLYHSQGGALVDIELLADTQTDYLQSAGGAMARFFFVN